jgi:CRP-like cAMP-binding protein
MAIDALVKPLLSLPLFRGLAPLHLTEIARRAERVIYAPGDVIAAENQLSDAAIVIVSGRCIRLEEDGGHSRGELLPEGAMISELAMLVDVVHVSTIIAQSPVKALRLTRERMRELMEDESALVEHFSSQIFGRLRRLAQDLNAVDTALARAASIPLAQPGLASAAHAPVVH